MGGDIWIALKFGILIRVKVNLDPQPCIKFKNFTNKKAITLVKGSSRAGHSLLLTLFANRYSATSMYHFAIATPLLF
jgi:hypothetical protein